MVIRGRFFKPFVIWIWSLDIIFLRAEWEKFEKQKAETQSIKFYGNLLPPHSKIFS